LYVGLDILRRLLSLPNTFDRLYSCLSLLSAGIMCTWYHTQPNLTYCSIQVRVHTINLLLFSLNKAV
jgi:hypothetical protein